MNKKWIAFGAFTLATGVALVDSLLLEQYFFKVKRFVLGSKDDENQSCRLLLITDLHLKTRLSGKHERLLDKLRELNPDIILLAGDTLDENGDPEVLNKFLQRLPAMVTKVAILGNHEHKNDLAIQSVKKIFKANDVDLLINESKKYRIGTEKITVTGLDDIVEGNQNFERAVSGVGYENMHVGLIHSPLQQDVVKEKIDSINRRRSKENQLNLSYLFAGHNHGGQVTAFGHPIVMPEKSGDFVKGWYNDSKPYLYVSKGFGNSTLPFRFGARAEIIVFDYFYESSFKPQTVEKDLVID